MSDTVLITWNITNWITVVLMVVVGWAIFKLIQTTVSNRAEASA